MWLDNTFGQNLIAKSTQNVVLTEAPEELELFEELLEEYFDDPTPIDLPTKANDDPLGWGGDEFVAAITIASAAVNTLALAFIHKRTYQIALRHASVEQFPNIFCEFASFEAGLAKLLEKYPHNLTLLTFQARLLANMQEVRTHGDTLELRHERSRIIQELNRVAIQLLGCSFNQLCGMGVLTSNDWRILEKRATQTAQANHLKTDAAQRVAQSSLASLIDTVWRICHETT